MQALTCRYTQYNSLLSREQQTESHQEPRSINIRPCVMSETHAMRLESVALYLSSVAAIAELDATPSAHYITITHRSHLVLHLSQNSF